jgi:hypothetical protein
LKNKINRDTKRLTGREIHGEREKKKEREKEREKKRKRERVRF